MTSRSPRSLGPWVGVLVKVAAAVAVVVLVVCAVLAVREARYRSCVAAAEARYPAVAVSAFTTEDTGPLKVSFVEERQAAVDACGR